MNSLSRIVALLACGCLATAAACGGDSGGGSTGSGGAGGDSTASGTGGTGGGASAMGGAAGGPAADIVEICPEIVEAACPLLAAFLPDEQTCASGLPMLAAVCGDALDTLHECTGPDPEITCDSTTGAPTSAGCEAEWGAVMTCVAELMSQGGAGG